MEVEILKNSLCSCMVDNFILREMLIYFCALTLCLDLHRGTCNEMFRVCYCIINILLELVIALLHPLQFITKNT